jgi:hypothetical protein
MVWDSKSVRESLVGRYCMGHQEWIKSLEIQHETTRVKRISGGDSKGQQDWIWILAGK